MTKPISPTALNGIRILDLSRVLAGPLCTQWLADLGAEVIKVERPGSGDESRTYGPPFWHDPSGKYDDVAAFYLACNRNKQSITVDHATPDGRSLLTALAAKCDVLVENYRPGVLKKYGLDYESLRVVNPRLIYLSITGFGQTGPYASRPGYDGIFQAMSGMMSVSGSPDTPMKVGASMVDILTSLFGSISILAALNHRHATGQGQNIDLALLDCGLASLSHFVMSFLVSGTAPARRGNGGFGGVPSEAFQCADKPMFVVAPNNKQFEALCGAIGRPDLPADQRFCSTALRIENRPAVIKELEEIFKTRRRDEWIELLEAADVPVSPINEIAEVFANQQVKHRRMLTEPTGPLAAAMKILANPINFSSTPVQEYRIQPNLGADTDRVLAKVLSLTDEQIAALRQKAAI